MRLCAFNSDRWTVLEIEGHADMSEASRAAAKMRTRRAPGEQVRVKRVDVRVFGAVAWLFVAVRRRERKGKTL